MPLCSACKKNQAVFTYERKTADGVLTEHYCIVCNKKLFLSVESELPNAPTTVCPYCGVSAEVFQKTGLAGCANCYRSMQSAAIPMVIRMQQGGKESHRGKISESLRPKSKAERRYEELLALKEYYEQSGNAELSARYERAAAELMQEIKRGNYDGA